MASEQNPNIAPTKVESVGRNPTFKHKQVRKLSDNQKVELVLQKETRPTPTSTNVNLAADFGVSPGLVAHTSYETLNPRQKALYEQKRSELKYHAFELTSNAVIKANELVKAATTKELNAVVNALRVGHEIHRHETIPNADLTVTAQSLFRLASLNNLQGQERADFIAALVPVIANIRGVDSSSLLEAVKEIEAIEITAKD